VGSTDSGRWDAAVVFILVAKQLNYKFEKKIKIVMQKKKKLNVELAAFCGPGPCIVLNIATKTYVWTFVCFSNYKHI
jgi:hypothetical protein